MGRRADKLLKAQAQDFIKEKKGYCTKEEKKAWRIAMAERKRAWRERLDALDEPARSAEKKKARKFWVLVYKKELLIGAAVLALLLAALIIIL